MRCATLALTILLLTAGIAAADEVQLKNGDRFTGDVIALAGGTLSFSTAYGTIRIPWSEVTAIVVQAPMIVTDAAGRVALQPVGSLALGDIVGLARPQPAVIVDGGANVGFVNTEGNTDVTSLRVDGGLVVRANANRYTADAAINRAADHGAETADNWTAGLKYDRFISTRMFINANSIFTHDVFRDLDLRTALGAGIGYQVVDTPLVRLTADAGLGYVSENLDAQPDDSYMAARESAKLDLFVIPGRMQLFHNHDGYFGVTGDDNLFFRTQNGARFSLAANFVTTLQLDLDYDKSPAAGRRNTDRTFALTLGYRF